MVSTSPFGQDGPKADFSSVDLIVMAASMLLYATGDGDLPPLHLSSPQAAMHAGAETAATVLIAHYGRERSGRGQHLDVSAQAALTMATQSAVLAPAWEAPGAYVSRAAGGLKVGPIVVRLLFPCKDGHVSCTFLFGSAIGPMSRRLMQVIHERGFCDASLAEKDFVNYQQLLMTFKEPITELFRAYAAIDAFFKTQTKAELFALAQERNLLIAPCSTLEDLVHSPQLDSRSYWVAVEHPELGRSFRYPGPFAKLSETPLTYRQRAPLLGEHNAEVFGSLGLTAGDLVALSGQAVL
jgi:crotonobetainyl-CoA:carnitine CoA-transferase CaiB-like acyl-CoA transferase